MKQVARSHKGEGTRDNHSGLYCHMSDKGWGKKGNIWSNEKVQIQEMYFVVFINNGTKD